MTLAPRAETYYNETLDMRLPTYQAFEVGMVVSRQNGKGSYLEARELAGLFLLGERLIIHSAHQFDTAKEAFFRIVQIVEGSDDLRKHVKRVVYNHGEEGIELRNGQRLRFRTRTKGGGRGFTGDCLILDEAMILAPETVGALMPTLSARPNPQLIYTGSSGTKDSGQLGRVRNRALRAMRGGAESKHWDDRLLYSEWSIDPCTDFCAKGCTEHDPEGDEQGREKLIVSYAKSNPALGYRVSVEHIDSERRSMDPENFRIERLGVGDWPVDGEGWEVISEEAWMNQFSPESFPPQKPLVFAVDTTPDRRSTCITAVGATGEGTVAGEITSDGKKDDHRAGTKWVVPRIKEIYRRNKPCHFVIDKASQALGFIDELESAGIPLIHPTSREYAEACGSLTNMIIPRAGNEPSFVHNDQEAVKSAVAGAVKRELADLWAWDKKGSMNDISPLVSLTLAVWGHKKLTNRPRRKPKAAWG